MCLDNLRLLMFGRFLLGLVELLNQRHRLSGDTTVELSAGSRGKQRKKLDGLHCEQGIKINTSEGKLLERPALRLNGRHCDGLIRSASLSRCTL